MADYFTNFSLVLALANEAQQEEALELAHQVETVRNGDEPVTGIPQSLKDVAGDWWFETDASHEAHGLWLHSDNGGIEAVCAFVQHLLQKFNPAGVVAFEWSHDCSKPRTDAYGGGAAVITAQDIKTLSTAQWLQEHVPPQPST